MKLKLLSLISALFLTSVSLINAQEWAKQIPQSKIQSNTVNFYDVQKAFNDYWQPYNVENGYYKSQGVDVKASGWKQFKRWEWLMESRITPSTGAFPTTTGIQEFQKTYGGFKAASATGDWSSLGPTTSLGGYSGLGRFNCIAFRVGDNNTYYAGAASSGLWKTTDNGSTWTVLTDENAVLGVSDVIVVPGVSTNTDIVYIGTGDRDGGSMWSLLGGQWNDNNSVGVLKSTDGGNSWQSTGLVFDIADRETVNRMLIDPADDNILYAATSAGFYKTTDAGTNWSQETTTAFIDLVMNPDFSNVLYASTMSGGIFKSTDSGETWTSVLSGVGSRIELAVSADNSNIVYALVSSGSAFSAIYKSTNSGDSFSSVFTGTNMMGWDCTGGAGGQASYDLCIAADPNDVNTVFVGGVNTWKSTDGGISWSINTHWSHNCGGTATEVHADKHFLVFQNGTSTLFECNDGGVYRSTDSGNTWTDLTNGIACSQIYRLGTAQTSPNDVIIGLQDNGTKSLNNPTWSDVIGGDGMECLIDFTDDNVQYGELYFGNIRRTDNKWASSTSISGSLPGGSWVTPFVIDPNDNNTLYVGMSEIWKSNDRGDSWVSQTGIGASIRSIAVAPSNSNYIYAATQSAVYRTTDGGVNWHNITTNLPTGSGSVTYLAVKYDDPDVVWATLGGYNNSSVYQSTNGAAWHSMSDGLPSIPIMCIVQNRQNTEKVELYVGTDVGVYLKMGDDNWAPFMSGLPNVVVTELDIYYDDAAPQNTRIRAATFGRGLWESEPYPSALVLGAEFSADITSGIYPLEVSFTDESTGTITSWSWDFGDGNNSTDQNPTHNYANPGTYTVSLTITDASSSDTETKTDYIEVVYPAPTPDFDANPIMGDIPLEVTFTDRTTGEIDTWDWDFGDGNSSTVQSPTHTYQLAGNYTVQLIATKGLLSDTLTRAAFITANTPPIYAGPDNTTCEQDPFIVTGAQAIGANSISWTTSGDGNFTAGGTTVSPTYVPGADDVLNGTVTLTMTALMSDGGTETDILILTIYTNPTADAGVDQTICENLSANLNATATSYSEVLWTTTGDGSFSDAASLTSIYYPGANDITIGSVDLTLTVIPLAPCSANATDDITINISPLPTVNAGPNLNSCGQDDVQLNATATDYDPASIVWSGGAGSFNSTSILNPIYLPTIDEVNAGTVTLTVTVGSQSPCVSTISDNIAITLFQAEVDAGGDVVGCSGEDLYVENATARDVDVVWTTSGTGTFNDNTLVNPTYTPSANDLLNTPITLTVTATAQAPCSNTLIDQMQILGFIDQPTVFSGYDTTICQSGTYETVFASTNGEESSLEWTTDGNGTFGGNQNNLVATYTPGTVDIQRGYANLTLTAYPNSPCTQPVTHSFRLTIQQLPDISAGQDEYVCEAGFIELTTASASYYNTLQWSTSGSGTFSDISVINPTYFPTAADVVSGVVLTLTATSNSPCAGTFSDAMTLTGVQEPTGYAGIDALICETESYFIGDATATNYSSVVWTTSGDGTFNSFNILHPTYTPGPNDIAAGNVILELNVNAINPCASNVVDALTLDIAGAPVIDVGDDVTICEGSTHTTNATVSNHSSFVWSTTGDGTFVNPTSLNSVYTPGTIDIANGSVVLTLTATGVTPCDGDRSDSFTLNIYQDPTVYAGADETICETAFTLAGATADNYSSIQWISFGSSGTITNANTLTPTYTASAADIAAGFVILQITANPNAPCATAAIDQVRLDIRELANVNAGPDASICEDQSYTVSGASVEYQSYYEWTSTGTGTLINAVNYLAPTYTPSAADIANGSVRLILTATSSAPCTLDIEDEMVLTFEPLPTVEAGPNSTICETGSFTAVGASVQNSGPILWTSSGSGSFVMNNVVNAEYIPSAADILNGSVRLTITAQSNTPCSTTVEDYVDITINSLPTANAGPDVPDLCAGDSYTISGASASNYNSINWVTSGSGTIVNPNSLTPTYIPSPADALLGTITLTLEAEGLPPCSITATDALLIDVIPGLVIDAGSDGSVCENSVFTVSDASALNYSSINWTSTGTGTITNANSLTPTYTPTADDIITGTITMTLTAVPIAPCADIQTDNIILTVYSEPSVYAGSDYTICEGTNFNIAEATADDYITVQWTSTGTGTFSNENIVNTTYIPSIADIASGVVTLTLTATGHAACGASPSDQMILTLLPAPTAYAGNDALVCEDANYTVSTATASNYNSLNWSHNGAGTLTNSGTLTPTYTPAAADIINGSVTLTLTTTGDALCTDANDQMLLTIVRNPIVEAGPDQIACQNDVHSIIHASIENSTNINWTTSGTGSFNNPNIINPIYTPSATDYTTGIVILTLTATPDIPCASDVSDNFALRFEELPTADAGLDASICQGSNYTISGASATNYTSVNWTSSGSGTFVNENSFTPTYTPSITDILLGSITLTMNVEGNSPCNNATDDMILTITEMPIVDAGVDAQICEGSNFGIVTASTANTSSISWSTSGTGSFLNGNSITPVYIPSSDDIAAGSVILTLTALANSPCVGQVADFTILTIISEPNAYAGADAIICSGDNYQVNDATAINYSSLVWSSSGWGTFINNGTLTPTYFPSASDLAAGSVIITLTANSIAPCAANANDSFILRFNEGPLVDAGINQDICEDGIYINTDASASNTNSVSWTSSGTGTFTDANVLNTSYMPSAADIADGAVTLTLTGSGNAPCTTDEDYVTISINRKPVVDAGSTTDICTGPNLIQGATAENYTSISWTTNGTGTFINASTLTPTYTPSPGDAVSGIITLTLTAQPLSGCSLPASSSINVNVNMAPTVNAGTDDIICEGDTYTLSATANNFDALNWSTSGTGTFSDPSITGSIYTPSTDDIAAGSVTLTLTASNASCTDVSDYMVLIIQQMPSAYAGDDSAICENGSYVVQDAVITNYSTISWTHNGTGILTNANTLSPIYDAGPGDVAAGSVTLTVTATSATPCFGTINDILVLEVKHEPTAYAGRDTTICESETYTIVGATATDFESVSWSTAGTGTFVNSGTLTPTYIPSADDIAAGNVVLRLHASNPPCTNITDQMTLSFALLPQIEAGFDGAVNFGSTFQITSANAANHTGLFWTSSGTGSFSDPTILLPTYTPSALDFTNGSVELTLTGSGVAPCGENSDFMTLLVVDQPGVDFTWDQACVGSETQFIIDTDATDVGTIVSWDWDFGDGNTSTLMEPTNTYSVPGTYSVTLTVIDINNFTGTVTHSITINPLPVVNFDIDAPSCSNLSTQFYDYSNTPTGHITQWDYNFGDGESQTIVFPDNPNIQHTYDVAGVYDVILTVTNSLGCSNSISRQITVVPSPIANFDMNSVCVSGGANFVDLSQANGGSNIVDWTWDFGDPASGLNNTSNLPNPTHIYAVDGDYEVTLTITNTNGCTSTITREFAISIQPDVDFNFTGNACVNNETQFNLVSDDLNIGNISAIEWNFGDGSPLSTDLNPSHTFTSTGSFLVSLYINNNGCETNITKTVVIYPSPIANFEYEFTCMNSGTQFTNLSNNSGSPITNWAWEFGVVTRTDDVSYEQDPEYVYTESGTYTVSLMITDANGCADINQQDIQVLPAPTSLFTYTNNYEDTQGRILMNNESFGATTYHWDFGDGGSSIEENPIYSYQEDGSYLIELISWNQHDCSDTTIQNYDLLFKGLFIPSAFAPGNPNQEVASFKAVGMNLSSFKIEVFDSWGNLLWESTALDEFGRPSESWDGTYRNEDLPSGVYVWKASAVFTDGSLWVGRDMGNNTGGTGKTHGTVTLIR